jgi:allantoinase
VDEFGHVNEADLRQAMPIVAALGLPLLVHAEWPAALGQPRGDRRRYATWLESRPPDAELAAIELMMRLAALYGTRVHIVHLATTTALSSIGRAKATGVKATVETCPHYLSFAAEEIADGDTVLKCAPPIRSATERAALWDALIDGGIDLVATDHSPAPPSLKHLGDGDFVAAWGGIASLQLGLAAVWTGAHARGMAPEHLAKWMSAGPARLAGLFPTKGILAPGADADLVIWDPDAESVVDQTALYHRHSLTPYHGRSLRGRVRTTILRGQVVYDEGAGCGRPLGRLL